MEDYPEDDAEGNLTKIFKVIEEDLGIPQLIEVQDIIGQKRPDEKSIVTYVAQLFGVPKEVFWIVLSYWNPFRDDGEELRVAILNDEERMQEAIRRECGYETEPETDVSDEEEETDASDDEEETDVSDDEGA